VWGPSALNERYDYWQAGTHVDCARKGSPLVPDQVTSAVGLTTVEARSRLTEQGANAVPTQRRVRLIKRIGNQLKDPLLLLLIAAVVLTVSVGDFTDAVVIAMVIIVNTTVGVIQEVRADRAVTALATLSAPRARVIRDGRQTEIPAADVVPGDALVLAEGDLVAADAELMESAALLVDESSVTGESVPVDKVVRSVDRAADDHVAAGTVVVRGRGVATVTATGASSTVGRMAALLDAGPQLTPLQRRLRRLSRVLAIIVATLCVAVAIIGLIRGEPLELMIITAISLAVAAVPESLPTVITLSLALGARRMAAKHAIVRRLPAVETLGSVSVIATDKTGTITEGRMVAQRVWTAIGEAAIGGTGYSLEGDVVNDIGGLRARDVTDLSVLMKAAVLCTDAKIIPPDSEHPEGQVLGDPTEAALLVAAEKFGLEHAALVEAFPRVDEFPFDSLRKRMTTVHRQPTGYRVICKGAPEFLLHSDVVSAEAAVLQAALAMAHEYAGRGLRVLAVAAAESPRRPASAAAAESNLQLLGLVGIADPAKASASGTIAAFRTAGITPILITGDHPATAGAIATQVGIATAPDQVVDGRLIGPGDQDQLLHSPVVARATPEQKVAIIDARRAAGEIVAMTGDGVNDGPALRHSDIGVAMGRRGTEVARQAADLVLADDELGTMVTAISEGRRIYDNVRRFLLFGMSGGAAEIMVMLAGPFLGMALPLLPAQILWINLLTHGLTGVALGAEPTAEAVMRRPPRPPAESVLGAGLWKRILRIAVLITAVTLAVALWGLISGREWQTMAFLTLGTMQLSVAIALRARPRTWANPFLLMAVCSAWLLQLAAVYVPPLAGLLGTQPLPLGDLAVVTGISLLGYAGIRLDRKLHPR
jgi:Ca2+-transporting ATPase